MTPYALALSQAQGQPEFLDLCDSRFHQNGYLHPSSFWNMAWEDYLRTRSYQPEALGPAQAREALAAWYAGRGLSVSPSRIFLTAGTSEAYRLLFSLRVPPGRTIALPRPGYPLFEHLARLSQREVEYYDLQASDQWSLTAESFEGLSPRAALLVLIEPHNPTGRVFTPQEKNVLRGYLEHTGVELVVDEVFEAWDHTGRITPAGLSFPNTRSWTLNGLSKRWASPDLKVAWCAVTGPENGLETDLEDLDTALDAVLSVQPFAASLVPRLCDAPDLVSQQVMRDLKANRAALADFQLRHPGVFTGHLPDGGIHWMPGISETDDEKACLYLLDKARIHLQPGYLYDVPDQGRVVMSLLKRPKEFLDGLERLAYHLS